MDNSPERLLKLFTKAPNAYFRHDVDVSLSAAVRMARFAQLAGVVSTFYIWARSPFYNAFDRDGQEAVATIRNLGHRIGLHVDYRNGPVGAAVERDLALFNVGYPGVLAKAKRGPGVHVSLVSFHMPPDCVLWRDFDGFESAYASKWEGRYLADSRGEFGPEKEARLDEMVADGGPIQVGLHPIHWFGA